MQDKQTIIEAQGISKSFGRGRARVDVLRRLHLSVPAGQFAAIMGPSGCGKSTLLHVLGLMTDSDAGEVILDGETVSASARRRTQLRRRKIGFVFQRFNLIPVLSGLDNIAISLQVRRHAAADGWVDRLLETMQVAEAARRKPGEMSIGEQQRVAVVRALAHSPDLLLADEPTGNLDSVSETALLDLLGQVHRDTGQSIVMITHSAEAAARADCIYRMQDGRILEPTS